MDDQRLALLARVASLYYEDGMNQNEVAVCPGLFPFTYLTHAV